MGSGWPSIPRPRGRGLIEASWGLFQPLPMLQFHDRAVVASLKRCASCGVPVFAFPIPRPRGRGLIEAAKKLASTPAANQFHDRAVVASLKRGTGGVHVR